VNEAYTGWQAVGLLESTADCANRKLLDIFEKAADLSYKLWTQRSYIHLRLPENPFYWNSKDTEAHGLHWGVLDDDDKCPDGKQWVLVTHPIV
jgi:hypothetical protein